MVTYGWIKELTLVDLENILTIQEILNKHMSKVSMKDKENVLFSNEKG